MLLAKVFLINFHCAPIVDNNDEREERKKVWKSQTFTCSVRHEAVKQLSTLTHRYS